jgi:hypothetical protein
VAPSELNVDQPDFWNWLAAVNSVKLNVGKQGNWSSADLLKQLKKERLPELRQAVKDWLVEFRRSALLSLYPWMQSALRD